MFQSVVKGICDFVCRNSSQVEPVVRKVIKRRGGRHHTKSIADGLRKGSKEAARQMAKWRWPR